MICMISLMKISGYWNHEIHINHNNHSSDIKHFFGYSYMGAGVRNLLYSIFNHSVIQLLSHF
jgi:hypothetical protein